MRNPARPYTAYETTPSEDETRDQPAGTSGVSGHRFTRANPQTMHLPAPSKRPKGADGTRSAKPQPNAPLPPMPLMGVPLASQPPVAPRTPVPSWLQPFTLPSNTRFTRTPDYLLRPQVPETVAPPVAQPTAELESPATAEADVPPVLPPRPSQTPVLRAPPRLPPIAAGAQPLIAALAREARAARLIAQAEQHAAPAPAEPATGHAPEETPATGASEIQADESHADPMVAAPPAAAQSVAPPADVVQTIDAALIDTGAVHVPTLAVPPLAVAPSHVDAGGEQPRSIQLIGEMIRLGWEVPPVAPSHQDTTPETAASRPVPASPVAGPVEAYTSPEPEMPRPAPAEAGASTVPVPAWIAAPIARLASYDVAPTPASFSWPVFTVTAEPAAQPAATAAPVAPVVAPVPEPVQIAPAPQPVAIARPAEPPRPAPRAVGQTGEYELPPLELLTEPPANEPDYELSEEFLDRNSVKLQQVLHDFGVRGEIIDANPGPVVTLYELEPAPGIKSSRVIGLSADIARSMSAISARVAVVEGRNVIGIELPNQRRETVWLREMLASHEFEGAKAKLGIGLGKTIGGEPVIVDLARMPHLLVAGTTGSGKSVAINTMILSLLYRHKPEQCRLIMIDPKMLELSVYEGIPHLLTPVVTDPKKAIVALKWAVREMEDRYRKMSRLGVRNIDGFNARVAEAAAKGEIITRTVQKGFDKETGELIEEEEIMDLSPLPYIVIVVDEMADLMMVAGKDIEGAIQRLAQMARAAGIHLIMATQRPSVDVITGTIKANFPTRISFQVTSKIDSRTILGEMGAEQLLGQGDMLYMAGGGRISRVHGPFVSDQEVERVVEHLKCQARPEYLDEVTAEEEDEPVPDDAAVFDKTSMGEDSGDLYDQAVTLVLRDKKASTSYIQRRLQIGYNRAASLMERMENEGIVGSANHAGKREILRDSH
ncbi:DNA translocase FtsK [Ancylobacter pratisalsi]|uniref:DNA translocase FtsK n=1 Tax=Ancylobacter pratisalsi TaxID=1745854 RepID=A0A6P1YR39_9HYPH|nr:DNA translocase FtsK [Ancylobacter pratisalsi]QIB35156.1 DNA translocase FtsK [Ancylobacter pratisalsi]